MFLDPTTDTDPSETDLTDQPDLAEMRAIMAGAPINPIDKLAIHVEDAIEAKAMLDEVDDIAAERPALQQRYIASLTEAGTQVTQALHLARQQADGAALPIVERPVSFADRVEAGRGDIALV